MTDIEKTLRSQMEDEFVESCTNLQNRTTHYNFSEATYCDDDDEWYRWKGLGAEDAVRIESLNSLAKALVGLDLSSILDTDLRELIDKIVKAASAVDSIFNSRKTRRSRAVPQSSVDNLRNFHREITKEARRRIDHETLYDIEIESDITRRTILHKKFENMHIEVSSILTNAQVTSEEIISEMERKIEARTEEAFPTQFSIEAKSARRRGYIWCVVSISLLIGTAWVLWGLSENIELDRRYIFENVAAIVASKLALAAILGYGIVWTVRMGQACMHEATVHLHRALSLASLERDVGVSGGQETALSRELAREAARAIYEPRETGYVRSKSRQGRSENAVVQGLKGMMEEMKEKKD